MDKEKVEKKQKKDRPPKFEEPFFSNDYFQELKGNKAAFVQWIAIPRENKEPKTQKQFAEIRGLREESLCRYKREDDFNGRVKSARIDYLQTYYTSEVLLANARKAARDGDPRAVKTHLQYADGFEPTTRQKTEVKQETNIIFLGIGGDGIEELQKQLKDIVETENRLNRAKQMKRLPEITYEKIPDGKAKKS